MGANFQHLLLVYLNLEWLLSSIYLSHGGNTLLYVLVSICSMDSEI